MENGLFYLSCALLIIAFHGEPDLVDAAKNHLNHQACHTSNNESHGDANE